MMQVMLDIPQDKLNAFLDTILDFLKFAPEYLKIKDEQGNIVPFILNELQLHVLKVGKVLEKINFLLSQPEDYEPKQSDYIRLDILKCRQTGITTLFQGIYIWLSLISFNQKMLMLGHDDESSTNMYDMFVRYYENLPKPMQPELDTKQQGKRLKYKKQENLLVVKTAGGGVSSQKAGTGRSSTFQYIHATECAFYPDYKTTMGGLLQASKKAKLIVRETTANGFNAYHDVWESAKSGKSDFTPIFLSWIDFKSYTKEFNSIDEETLLVNDLGVNIDYNSFPDEELILVEKHGCSLEQLNWRRWAINNLCENDVELFHQEYPTTDTEAFVATGRPVFDTRLCTLNLNNAEKPLKVGFLDYIKDDRGVVKGVEFRESNKGYLKIYDKIEVSELEYNVFAAGSDVAEGLAQGDYSVIKVLDRRTNKVVITWHGHIDPDLFGEEYHKLSIFLRGKVWINPESNNHGIATINKAYQLDVPMMYRQDFEQGIEITKDQIGTKTSGGGAKVEQSKTFMINELNAFIRDELFQDPEKEFWEETLTFVRTSYRKMEAEGKSEDSKTYDDRVMAEAMMIRCHKWMPNYCKKVVEEIPEWVKKMQKKNVKKTKMSV